MIYPEPIQDLISQLAKLPGVGPKTAQRLAFFLLNMPQGEAELLATAIVNARTKIRYCSVCFNFTDTDPCAICRNSARDNRIIMVVEQPKDVVAMEKTREFKGRYHVLHGAISPMEGIGPDDLRIKELLMRIQATPPQEIVLATSSSLEGEATALYLGRLLKPMGFKVTRIARGLPMGGDLDYTDEVTLLKALEGRQEV
ncbi:recombination mediator RecR [Sulfobacillus thermosulfidooxidans]|uniref:Recombination protein RecR n=1 Tax=Sulfobacillus thermosulfidooxidans TaxID=28034 RepID=A0A1R0IKI0_SULTH|nr:recombination mediator RecR [Sulfobacillus thermosulfidooxidans]OLZ11132.1 recombination protein RecR [Sulfobacillus thermosulfidooxidans]OLZ14115.1 recombination protein RecR [Sulfobacillus thermosulfidooxidans]OLZ18859.1 recombination protein RecR [Sulfobacillus thermosulfidooxidans]PSR26677.1 MAG: recombination protein RecR [Sulfobacillus thermosulfidooxidans]